MDIEVAPGVYVMATSGGVDSMALLHLLRHKTGVMLIVAHYDHGIRADSHEDRKLIQDVTRRHNLQFVYDEGKLGSDASEETARNARYKFLHDVRKASGARAIITAHHQDDLLETAILNMLRGTGRRGLVSLRSREQLHRPLLHVPKSDLIAYARDQGLVWREDSTNVDSRYKRNHVRHNIVPKMSFEQKQTLLGHIHNVHELDQKLEHELTNHLHLHPGFSELDRHWFVMLPHAVAREVMVTWLRRHDVRDVSAKTIERIVAAAKTYLPGTRADVDKSYELYVTKAGLVLTKRLASKQQKLSV